MMNVSEYTLLTGVLIANVYLLLAALLSRKDRWLQRWGIFPLMGLLLAGIVRLFCSVEFRFAQMVVRDKFFLPTLQRATHLEIGTLSDGSSFRVSALILFIWALVGMAFTVHFIVGHLLFWRQVHRARHTHDAEAYAMFATLPGVTERHCKQVKIVQTDAVDVPMVTGFFRPVILLPFLSYSEQDLCYIIHHEWMHFKGKDVWIKLLVKIAFVIFWWNPWMPMFQRNINQALELRCDSCVVAGFGAARRVSYLETILKIYKESASKHSTKKMQMSFGLVQAFFGRGKKKDIKQRFCLVLDSKNEKSKKEKAIIAGFFLALAVTFLFSVILVVQPYTPPPSAVAHVHVELQKD